MSHGFCAFFISILLVGAPCQILWAQTDRLSYDVLNLDKLRSAYSKILKGEPAGIVSFNSELRKAENLGEDKNAFFAATEAILVNDRPAIRVQGKFKLLGTISGKLAPEEKVARSIVLDFAAIARNAEVLGTVSANNPTLLFLVIRDPAKPSFLEGRLIGPIRQRDVRDLLSANELAKDQYTVPDDLLESGNVWAVYLGLVQLDLEKRLSIFHFARASARLPAEYTEMLANDLFDTALSNKRIRAGMDKYFFKVIQSIDPVRQEMLLKKLNSFVDRNPHLTERIIDMGRFKKDLAGYREKLTAQPGRQAVLAEIDRVLKRELKKQN